MQKDPIVIVGMARTPLGNMLGRLKDAACTQLGATAIKAAVERSKVNPDEINEIIMGCVLPAGQGQAPARQAAIGADIPLKAGATTINKMCGSGMKAVMFAHDLIAAGTNDVMIAGGMENMSAAPYLIPKARGGYRLGHAEIKDHMMLDGLEDAYAKGTSMGVFAEQCAEKYNFTREAQDEFAINSLKRAQAAQASGEAAAEIAEVTLKTRKGDVIVDKDENPQVAMLDKIPKLRPAFKKDGTVTAANSSSISDGAAALVLMRQSKAENLGLKPLAKICAHATQAQEPEWFTTAPVAAIKKVLNKVNWNSDDVDLYEINEAFAVVTMAAMHDLELSADKVNIYGGACAIGHPIGASGARILVTLINALKQKSLKRGVAALCIGGGEATAIAIEAI